MKNNWILGIALVVIIIGAFAIFSNNKENTSADGLNIGTSVGEIAPDYSFTTITGESISSNDLSGKTVVITSSAAWCNTCVAEAREFAQVYPKFSTDEVVFITADIDPRNSIAAIQEFQSNTNSPWHYTNAEGGSDLAEKLKLNRFEITYVIDGGGIITFKDAEITDAAVLLEAIEKTF